MLLCDIIIRDHTVVILVFKSLCMSQYFKVSHSLRSRIVSSFFTLLILLQNILPGLQLSLVYAQEPTAQIQDQSVALQLTDLSLEIKDATLTVTVSKPITSPIQITYKNGEIEKGTQGVLKTIAGSQTASFSTYLGTCSGDECVADKVGTGKVIFPENNFEFEFSVSEKAEEPVWFHDATTWMTASIVVDTVYIPGFDQAPEITFTKLPAGKHWLKVVPMTLSAEQISATGALSPIAYDITTDMPEGSFSFDLTLPTPEKLTKAKAVVKYAETLEELTTVKTFEALDSVTTDSVTVKNIEHLTVFVVTTIVPAATDAFCVANATTTGDCYNTLLAAITAANTGDTIKIANGNYSFTNVVIPAGKPGLTLEGESKAGVTIHTTAVWGFDVQANNTVIKNVTLIDDSTQAGYHLKIYNSDGFTFENSVMSLSTTASRGGLDLNSVKNSIVKDVSIQGYRKNGYSLTSVCNTTNTSQNARLENVAVSNVSWNGFVFYLSAGPSCTPGNSAISGVEFAGTNSVQNAGQFGVKVEAPATVGISSLTDGIVDLGTFNFSGTFGFGYIANQQENDLRAVNANFDGVSALTAISPELNTVESRISHDCVNSSYIHGACNGLPFDFDSTFGSVEYATAAVCQEEAGWATSAVMGSTDQGLQKSGLAVPVVRSNTTSALAAPEGTAAEGTFFSLGQGGYLTVEFVRQILNVPGVDISIHEITNGRAGYPLESATVKVSQDGTTWFMIGTASSLTNNGGPGITQLDFSSTGLDWVRYVQVTDTTNFNLNPNMNADGFDIDAIGAVSLSCEELPPEPVPFTLNASKIVCENETDLPNWNGQGVTVTASTAQDYVTAHPTCSIAPTWDFQWAGIGAGSFGEFQTHEATLGSPWTTFSAVAGVATAVIPDVSIVGGRIEVREVMPEGYIPFSNAGDVTAELVCTGDGVNYDNWEWINNPQGGGQVTCVAFNVLDTHSISGTKFSDVNGDGQRQQGEVGLGGWTIKAVNPTPIDTLTVNSQQIAGVDSVSLPVGRYLFVADGEWTNRNNSQERYDAEYGTLNNWSTFADGLTGYGVSFGDLQINSGFTAWGPRNATQEYLLNYDQTVAGSVNLAIFDGPEGGSKEPGWYGDNNGSIAVTIYQVYDETITAADGSYDLTLPASATTAHVYELPQEGWTQIAPNNPRYHVVTFENGDTTGIDFANQRVIETSTITMCKENDLGQPLAGWTLGLMETATQSIEVPVISDAASSLSVAAGDYVMMASGTYRYGDSAMIADAGSSFRPTYIPYGNDNWVYGLDLPSSGILTARVGNRNAGLSGSNGVVSWGPFSTAHTYTALYAGHPGGNLDFWLYDDNYLDNAQLSPALSVELSKAVVSGQTNQSGCVTFPAIPEGDYNAFEIAQSNYTFSSFEDGQTTTTSNPAPVSVDESQETFTFTNEYILPRTTSISGYKIYDLNADGVISEDERTNHALNEWNISLYNSSWTQVGGTASTGEDTWADGFYQFDDLVLGQQYYVCEAEVEAWTQQLPQAGTGVVTQPDTSSRCYSLTATTDDEQSYDFANSRLGSVGGRKWIDTNGDSQMTEDEEEITADGFTMTLTSSDEDVDPVSTLTATDGAYAFANLQVGEYELCEEVSDGFDQTYPLDELDAPSCHEVSITLEDFDQTGLNFGNVPLGLLSIAKFNNVGPVIKKPGDIVEYTLEVSATEGSMTDVIVTDVPPEDFEYKLSSWTATSSVRGDIKGSVTTEPTYGSPGDWLLGTMVPGEVVTLTYQAVIGNDITTGTHPDLAFARGTRIGGATLLAQANPTGYISDEYVGTRVQVAVSDPAGSASVSVERKETQEQKTSTSNGQVLGASTMLPATGLPIALPALGILAVISGCLVMLASLFRRKSGSFSGAIALGLLVLGMAVSHLVATPVLAQSLNPLNIRVMQLPSPYNQRSFKLRYVTLDINNRAVGAECFKKAPGDADFSLFSSTVLKLGGDNFYCQIAESMTATQGTYQFYVKVTAGTDIVTSPIQAVDINTSGPGVPTNYSKTRNGCTDRLQFTSADDSGKTVRLEVYRSDSKNYTANSGTRIDDFTSGSKQSFTKEYGAPDCNKTYYYSVRAFDTANNGSGLVGDTEAVITYTTTSSSSNTTQTTTTSGPLAVAGGSQTVTNSLGTGGTTQEGEAETETTAENIDTPTESNTGTNPEGQVLGESDENFFASMPTYGWWIGGVAVVIGLFFALRRLFS